MPRVIKVIESHVVRGTRFAKDEIKSNRRLSKHPLLKNDLVRNIIQYHTLDGEFLSEFDPRTEKILDDFNLKERNNK